MNKCELAQAIAKKTDGSVEIISQILDAMTEEITEALKMGKTVKLFGFGKFQTRNYKERKCYNPQTGKMMTLKPSIQPAFTPGPKLREALNK